MHINGWHITQREKNPISPERYIRIQRGHLLHNSVKCHQTKMLHSVRKSVLIFKSYCAKTFFIYISFRILTLSFQLNWVYFSVLEILSVSGMLLFSLNCNLLGLQREKYSIFRSHLLLQFILYWDDKYHSLGMLFYSYCFLLRIQSLA